jgi:hypothetical protein
MSYEARLGSCSCSWVEETRLNTCTSTRLDAGVCVHLWVRIRVVICSNSAPPLISKSSDISNRSVLFPRSPKVVLVLGPGSLRLLFLNNLAAYPVSTVFEIAEMKRGFWPWGECVACL